MDLRDLLSEAYQVGFTFIIIVGPYVLLVEELRISTLVQEHIHRRMVLG